MAWFAWSGHYLSVLNQILLHYYTSLLFIWGWRGGGSSLKVQLPDYCPILLRAHFFSPFPTISFPQLGKLKTFFLFWYIFIEV
uniref:Uncharacterized protein n=1 Tax=Ursus americanus TaxID=9643 RepID=A0A452RTX4_URSAM